LFFIVRSTDFFLPFATISLMMLQNGCIWGDVSRDRQAAVPRFEVGRDGFLKSKKIF
jgi:hypothetical protein